MKLPNPLPIVEIAREYNAELLGDSTLVATGINEIHKVEKGDITFSDVEKYFKRALQSAASIIILNKKTDVPEGKAILVCDDPFHVYDSLVAKYRTHQPVREMIDKSARIDASAVIEPNVVIGPNVTIGAGSFIGAGAVIRENTEIGERVIIESGSVIGSEAFYFKNTPDGNIQWTSGGKVIIENDVFIGANCTIARGVSGITRIGEGSKLDCLIQIGHGAVVGKHCVIAAQVGISGKTIIGDRCRIYGQVGIAQSLTIGDDVTILAKSGVPSSIESGKLMFGIPADDARKTWRMHAAMKQLPEALRKIERLSKDHE